MLACVGKLKKLSIMSGVLKAVSDRVYCKDNGETILFWPQWFDPLASQNSEEKGKLSTVNKSDNHVDLTVTWHFNFNPGIIFTNLHKITLSKSLFVPH